MQQASLTFFVARPVTFFHEAGKLIHTSIRYKRSGSNVNVMHMHIISVQPLGTVSLDRGFAVQCFHKTFKESLYNLGASLIAGHHFNCETLVMCHMCKKDGDPCRIG